MILYRAFILNIYQLGLDLVDLVKIIAGLTLLYYGGNSLVTGSVRVARLLKISPFIIGATVIAFGTSAPELAVALLAALQGTSELAMGNVIGSNIANIGLVLGLTPLIASISIKPDLLKREFPPLLTASILIVFFAWNLEVNRYEGLIMVCLLGVYVWRSFSNKEDFPEKQKKNEATLYMRRNTGIQIFLIIISLAMLIGGAELLISGGVGIARNLGVSEWLIGITIVAVGTSLPEIVSSITAAKRGHGEMAIGNIFGSNIFNILMVLGLTASIQPLKIKEPIHPDLIISMANTVFLLGLITFGNHSLGKSKGVALLLVYSLYIVLKGAGIL